MIMTKNANTNELYLDDQPFKNSIFRIGAISALVILILIPIQIVFYILWPHPDSIIGWFELFQRNWLLGLIGFDLLYMLSMIPMILLFIAMFFALFKTRKLLSIIAVIFGLMGIAIYFSSNTAIEMLSVSQQYAQATTEQQKEILLAAGQTFYSMYGGTAYAAYYILNGLALILFFIAMIPNTLFRKSTAYIGLSAGILMLVPATAGIVGMTMSLLSLLPWSVFCVLVAQDFMKISKRKIG